MLLSPALWRSGGSQALAAVRVVRPAKASADELELYSSGPGQDCLRWRGCGVP